MPASIQNLYSQSQSLRAYTTALQVTGQNIASNADANYSRQDVTIKSTGVSSVDTILGSSVSASLKDTRDQLLESQLWREQTEYAQQTEQLSYLEQLELSLFPGNDETLEIINESGEFLSDGLASEMSQFFTTWSSLSGSPNDTTTKTSVYVQAETLVDRFHQDAASLADLSNTVNSAVEASVSAMNKLAAQVATLQGKIATLPEEGSMAKAELIASRNAALSELSKYTTFTWTESASDPLSSTLTVRLADGSTTDLLTGSQVNDTLSWDGTSVSLATSGDVLAADSGVLGAQLKVLNEDIADLENNWNLLAGEMVRVVNSIYNPDGTEGANFFAPEGTTAASISLEVAAATDIIAGTNGNGNDIASTLGDLFDADLSDEYASPLDGSFTEALLNVQYDFATKVSNLRDAASTQEKVISYLEEERASVSGVDLDAEVTKLLQFQRGFQATSRVLTALDETLQTFLSDIS